MKAVVLSGKHQIRVEDISLPELVAGEVLVRVKATGVCGSDLPRVFDDGAHYYPIVLGHEFAGEVVEVAADVETLKVGDRVAGAPLIPCHRCSDCLQGQHALCKNYTFIGSRIFGSWAEYVKMPAINGVKLPAGVSFEQGALLEPVTVGLHGLFVMDFQGGFDTAVVGAGTIGLLTLQCAKALGAKRLFAFDIDDERLDAAAALGADVCINTGVPDFRQQIEEETEGRGFPMVIETAGVEFTEKLSLEVAAAKGKVMFIGTPSRPITLQPKEFEYMNRKELKVGGSWMSYSAPFPGREWDLAGFYFSKGMISSQGMIDREISFAEVGEAFADLAIPGRVKGKIMLKP